MAATAGSGGAPERDAFERLRGGGEAELNCVAAATTVAEQVAININASAPVSEPAIAFSRIGHRLWLVDLVVENGRSSSAAGEQRELTPRRSRRRPRAP